MTPRKKPTAVFVFGILNIVFGAMSLISFLCCGVVIGGLYGVVMSAYGNAPPEVQKDLDDLGRAFVDNVPGLVAFLIAYFAVGLMLGLMQIISGVGLVRIRPWARWMCVLWGVLEIMTIALSLFYLLAILNPGLEKAVDEMERIQERLEQKQRRQGMNPPPRQKIQRGTGNPVVDNVLNVLFSLFSLGYAALVTVYLLLPGTGQAIARYNAPEDFGAPEDRPDYYDADFDRRRREVEPPPDLGPPGEPSPWREPPPPGDEPRPL
jgi:hypothetical protein